jgi:hypothetical protein
MPCAEVKAQKANLKAQSQKTPASEKSLRALLMQHLMHRMEQGFSGEGLLDDFGPSWIGHDEPDAREQFTIDRAE